VGQFSVGDNILIYELKTDGAVIFTRAGTHSELFE
jgi:mRNA-degrading endonuclease YafQ of YafQ-DinJ toxin-antitoxin module